MERLTPARNENNVPIVFAANNFFIPYTAVMIQSVMEHASPEKHYDIILLHSEEPGDYRERLQRLASRYGNCTLRLCNVSEHCRGISFYTGGGNGLLTPETYYRLMLGDVLSEEYEKVIYLDGDMVACTDVAALLDFDLDGYYLAAAVDLSGISDVLGPDGEVRKRYWENVVKLERLESYFIAGVLVFNLPEFRRDYPVVRLLALATEREWMFHDQDILNFVCRNGKAKLISPAWGSQSENDLYRFLPKQLQTLRQEARRHPLIVHYAGSQKPWNGPCVREHFFWQTAARTEFFETIVSRAIAQAQKDAADCKFCSPEQIEAVRQGILKRNAPLSWFGILKMLGIEHEVLGLAGRLELALYRYCPRFARPLVMVVRKLYQIKHERKF